MNFHIRAIPDSIGQLFNLEYLNLMNNQINGAIPNSFSNLSNLKSL